ncbi:hypothetical protein GCM10011324_43990 [Allosediminivita pacifica]|nr:hypothetical protein GCM10011324_43990 [Allosediminivita pacifica]
MGPPDGERPESTNGPRRASGVSTFRGDPPNTKQESDRCAKPMPRSTWGKDAPPIFDLAREDAMCPGFRPRTTSAPALNPLPLPIYFLTPALPGLGVGQPARACPRQARYSQNTQLPEDQARIPP